MKLAVGSSSLKKKAKALTAFTIKEASDRTGLGQAVLRSWERRYGWPRVKRGRNSYRSYSYSDIQEMLFVKKAIGQGQKITDLIDADGYVCGLRKPRPAPVIKLPPLPTPATRSGQDWQRTLSKAFACNNVATAHAGLAAVTTIHPVDRAPAVWWVIAAWLQLWKKIDPKNKDAALLDDALRASAGARYGEILDTVEEASEVVRYAPTIFIKPENGRTNDDCCRNHETHQTAPRRFG